jgi:uncharacterized OB-fold protein
MAAIYKPVVQPWAKKFWENARLGKLTIQKCSNCGKYVFIPKLICPDCSSEDLEWTEISGKGKVYTFSCKFDPIGASNPDIIMTAAIDLEEGARMVSSIVNCKPEDLHCGMPVKVVFEKLDDEFTLPKFMPVDQKRK